MLSLLLYELNSVYAVYLVEQPQDFGRVLQGINCKKLAPAVQMIGNILPFHCAAVITRL